jgi:hypothetical protein
MRKTAWAAAAVVLAACGAGRAEFEGVLNMKMTSPDTNGTMKLYVSKRGVRNEMDMKAGKGKESMNVRMVMLSRSDKPGLAYRINDETRTYSEVDLNAARPGAAAAEPKFTVKKLGRQKAAGYDCEHVLVTGERGEQTELWTTRDLMDHESFSRAMGPRPGHAGYSKSLREAGVDGFPVKSVSRGPRGEATVELVSAEKKSLPASLFEVPAGYKKQVVGPAVMGRPGGAAGPGSPDAMKAMQEQLKDMPPDQREMIEKMMKQKQGGRP